MQYIILLISIISLVASTYYVLKGWRKIKIYPDKLRNEYAKQLRIHNILLVCSFVFFILSLILFQSLFFYGAILISVFISISSLYLYHFDLAMELKDIEKSSKKE